MDNGNLDELIETIQSSSNLLARGGMTKSGIQNPPDIDILDLSIYSGIQEYIPSEYTFTALAGTRLKEINQMLSDNGQFLPFDPPLAAQGATLGGTVASNLSGPMRFHYGGVRDFILGVKFLNYRGQLVRTGGKVVKNAAGFDIPKLMVGSLGSLGTMVELSFKVFPQPGEFITLVSNHGNLADAMHNLIQLTSSSIEILCLELEPREGSWILMARLGGDPSLFGDRISNFGELLKNAATLQGEEEINTWDEIIEFQWVPENTVLVKVPIIPKNIPLLDDFLNKNNTSRRYSAGANVAWIAWSEPISRLDQKLKELNLMGLSLLGNSDQVRLGAWERGVFYNKIKNALDPSGLWVEV